MKVDHQTNLDARTGNLTPEPQERLAAGSMQWVMRYRSSQQMEPHTTVQYLSPVSSQLASVYPRRFTTTVEHHGRNHKGSPIHSGAIYTRQSLDGCPLSP